MSYLANFFKKSAQPQRYKLLARLTTYSGSLHALAISNDGHILAGGVSCGVWAMTRKATVETLCYGTGLGYIIFLRRSLIDKNFQEICTRRLGSGFEITCLSWHLTSSESNIWIAVETRDNMVQVLILNTSAQLQSVFAVRLDNTVPKSIAFTDNRDIYVFGLYDGNVTFASYQAPNSMKLEGGDAFTDNRDIYVFGLYDGNVTFASYQAPNSMKLEGGDGNVVKEISCQSVIGHAAVCQKRGVFVVDNATDGFTLYRLEGEGQPVRTFATAPPSVSVPKQVAFGEEGKVVMGGSDNGLIYIFDRKTGQTLETLHHADIGLVS
ncbi:hypothetical protein M405DRAFT_847264 [Rhizopogon salebrosus TDB-379]|nr:hypothetical protein M405DRAFT_847264 [Rhizopogon salebrosus TDB-379]